MSWLQSGPNVGNFFHPVGVSVSIRQFTGDDSEYIALEKELKVLDFAGEEGERSIKNLSVHNTKCQGL